MKNVFLMLFVFVVVKSNAQEKRMPISKMKIGTVNCLYEMSINLDKGDTVNYIGLSFQNSQYSSITDIKSIFFFNPSKDSSSVLSFVKNLKMAYNEMGNKTAILWDKKEYSISLYDFTNLLYLREPRSKGDGHTMLTKKDVEKLINWFNTIGFDK